MPVLILKDRVTKIIEPSDKETEFAESILKESLVKKLHIVNLLCLYSHFHDIKKLLDDPDMLKIFHGGSQKIFNDMITQFELSNREDFYYAGQGMLSVIKVETAYWNYKKLKPFSFTLLKGEEI